ncbi:MAG: alpha/beta hydrolase [Myxococcota bacterium]
MVQKGEFLERPALIAVGDLWLEGLYHRGDDRPGLLICPPIAGEIGMDAPPVAELAFQTARSGRASLRFQHRGFGASQGAPDASLTLADAEAARVHLEACIDAQRVDVAGYLSGAGTAVEVARACRRVRHVCLIAPPDLLDLAGLEDRRVLVILAGSQGQELKDAWRARLEGIESAVERIEGADPKFLRGLPALGERVVAWLGGAQDLELDLDRGPGVE